ncbi:MAG: sulfatase [Planctomycetes bacterium]|nr:sulfatase [Planctomycetota bacterium]
MSELTRRDFIKNISSACGAGIFASTLASCGITRSDLDKRPNIVLFLSDDHSRWVTGCYGNKHIRTPNMDKLATQGCQFMNAFCASPTCAPSRMSIYTGLYPNNHGAHQNHSTAHADVQTLPVYMKELGYTCILAGKQHYRPSEAFPFATVPNTAKYWSKEHIYLVKETNNVGNTIDRLSRRQPFCMIIATHNSHSPYPEVDKPYGPQDVQLAPRMPDNDESRQKTARYYDAVTALDDELGIVMDKLEEKNLADNTLFIYTADHGQDGPHAKYNLYDQGIHVPFIARWPGVIKEKSTSQAMISFIDLMPTFMDIAGQSKMQKMQCDGRSFLPVLEQKTDEHRDLIFTTHTRDKIPRNLYPMRSVRNKKYKYIWNLMPKYTHTAHGLSEIRESDELYDIVHDPHELKNLSSDPQYAAIKKEMRDHLLAWMKKHQDPGNEIPESEFIAKIERDRLERIESEKIRAARKQKQLQKQLEKAAGK